jgi:hypothetical protein
VTGRCFGPLLFSGSAFFGGSAGSMLFSRIAAIFFPAFYVHRKNGDFRLHFKGLPKMCVRMEASDGWFFMALGLGSVCTYSPRTM